MPIALVTLDLDGTLWDSVPALDRAERAVYEWLAAELPAITARRDPAAIVAHRRALMEARADLRHDFTRLRRVALSQLAVEAGYAPDAAEPAIEVFVAERSRVDIYPDTLPALERLAARYRIVALTNGNADVERAGVGRYVEFTVSPAVSGRAKPDPAVFDPIVKRTGVPLAHMAHVGDEPLRDHAAAHAAGVRSVWINRAGAHWPDLAPPHAEIATLAELEAVLAALALAG